MDNVQNCDSYENSYSFISHFEKIWQLIMGYIKYLTTNAYKFKHQQ
jgi:hypothetical protein